MNAAPDKQQQPAILWSDEHLLVVDKPAGWLSQPTPEQPAALSSWLAENHQTLPDLPHRLDRNVSGIVMAARTKGTRKWLDKVLAQRKVEKWYLAIVRTGQAPVAMRIAEPILQLGPGRMCVDPRGKRSYTQVVPVAFDAEAELALVAVALHTGRTHQARVHLAYAVGAIVGDRKYGDFATSPRLALHAAVVRLPAAGSVAERTITSRPGPDFWKLAEGSALATWDGPLTFSRT